MPKIRVEIDVPDGEWCRDCMIKLNNPYGAKYCRAFKEPVGTHGNIGWVEIKEGRRLPQCIAAEVDAVSSWQAEGVCAVAD